MTYEALKQTYLEMFFEWLDTETSRDFIPNFLWEQLSKTHRLLNVANNKANCDMSNLTKEVEEHLPLMSEFPEWGCKKSATFTFWTEVTSA